MSQKIKNQLINALNNEGIYPDGVIAKKNGTFVVRKSYFYRHGMSAEKWGQRVMSGLDGNVFALVAHQDAWAEWPKTSYFEAVVKPVQ